MVFNQIFSTLFTFAFRFLLEVNCVEKQQGGREIKERENEGMEKLKGKRKRNKTQKNETNPEQQTNGAEEGETHVQSMSLSNKSLSFP